MKQSHVVACVAVAVLSAYLTPARTVLAAGDEPGVKEGAPAEHKKEKPDASVAAAGKLLGVDYETMVAELQLTEEQQAAVKEKLAAMAKAKDDWKEANKAEVRELKETAKQARKAGNEERAGELRRQISELRALRDNALAPHKTAVLAVLTPEQKQKWAALVLASQVTRRWRHLQLTEEQQAAILAACQAALKDNLELDLTDEEAVEGAAKELLDELREKVLTEEQRAAPAKPKPKPKPAEQPAPAEKG